MSKNPLDVLKSGLTKLKNLTKSKKDDLLARLHRKEKISTEEEEWLDNVANLVDEEAIIDFLENASDYDEHGLARLNSQQKSLVEKLKELGGGVKKATGSKRNRMGALSFYENDEANLERQDLKNAGKNHKQKSRKPSPSSPKKKTQHSHNVSRMWTKNLHVKKLLQLRSSSEVMWQI